MQYVCVCVTRQPLGLCRLRNTLEARESTCRSSWPHNHSLGCRQMKPRSSASTAAGVSSAISRRALLHTAVVAASLSSLPVEPAAAGTLPAAALPRGAAGPPGHGRECARPTRHDTAHVRRAEKRERNRERQGQEASSVNEAAGRYGEACFGG